MNTSGDEVQGYLSRWHQHRDEAAFIRAFRQLRQEWAGPVARFLRLPMDAVEVELVLSDMLCALLGAERGAAPRALAPADYEQPAAWRRRVLSNALRDDYRRKQAYGRAVAAATQTAATGGPAAAAEPPTAIPTGELAAPAAAIPLAEEQAGLKQMLRIVVNRLPQVEVRRRVVLTLALDLPIPAAWQGELALALDVPEAVIAARVRAYEAAPYDEDRRVEVVYGQAQPREREAYRKTLERARAELQQLIHRGQA